VDRKPNPELEAVHKAFVHYGIQRKNLWALAQKYLDLHGFKALYCGFEKLKQIKSKVKEPCNWLALLTDILNNGDLTKYFSYKEEVAGYYPEHFRKRER